MTRASQRTDVLHHGGLVGAGRRKAKGRARGNLVHDFQHTQPLASARAVRQHVDRFRDGRVWPSRDGRVRVVLRFGEGIDRIVDAVGHYADFNAGAVHAVLTRGHVHPVRRQAVIRTGRLS
jgi:hypothetical protein